MWRLDKPITTVRMSPASAQCSNRQAWRGKKSQPARGVMEPLVSREWWKNPVQILPPAGYSSSWGRTGACSDSMLLPQHWHSCQSWWCKLVGGCEQKAESERGKCELLLQTLNNWSQGFSPRGLWPFQSALVHVNELCSSWVLCLHWAGTILHGIPSPWTIISSTIHQVFYQSPLFSLEFP